MLLFLGLVQSPTRDVLSLPLPTLCSPLSSIRRGFGCNARTQVKQDEVFERVAAKVVLGALDGYNGTVFAYGQTGSGKTFTITGGADKYIDRGIIPRAVSRVYAEIAKRCAEARYVVDISYIEIYNDQGYDLLDPSHDSKVRRRRCDVARTRVVSCRAVTHRCRRLWKIFRGLFCWRMTTARCISKA